MVNTGTLNASSRFLKNKKQNTYPVANQSRNAIANYNGPNNNNSRRMTGQSAGPHNRSSNNNK